MVHKFDNEGSTPPPAQNTAKHEATLRSVPTCELVAELRTREGVETTVVEPYDEASIHASDPAIVLKVID